MPIFKNYNEFEKFFNSKLQKAMELTRDEVFEIVSGKVMEYYTEPVFDNEDPTIPKYYPNHEYLSLLKIHPNSHVVP